MDFIAAIENRQICVGIMGLGYVGLPLAVAFAEAGFSTIGCDVDSSKIQVLRAGRSYLHHIPSDKVSLIRPTDDWHDLKECHAIIVCVPTPLTENREPDLQYIRNAAAFINHLIYIGANIKLVSLESTTYPGTTEEVFLNAITANTDRVVGETLYVVYSPEREDPGNKSYSLHNTPKVIGGITKDCLRAGTALYGAICELVPVASVQTAEMVKILENTYRAVNIALVNELKMLCLHLGIDIWEVIRAAATKPFGFQAFWPGPGWGGHCINIDPFYLEWRARKENMQTKFIELSGEINDTMPRFVVERVYKALNKRSLPMRGSRILIIGVAYKSNVSDTRETPAHRIIKLLKEEGAVVDYHDSMVPVFEDMQSVTLRNIHSYDLVLVLTVHTDFDVEILSQAQLVVDTRGVVNGAYQA